jgi:hypothetical protein
MRITTLELLTLWSVASVARADCPYQYGDALQLAEAGMLQPDSPQLCAEPRQRESLLQISAGVRERKARGPQKPPSDCAYTAEDAKRLAYAGELKEDSPEMCGANPSHRPNLLKRSALVREEQAERTVREEREQQTARTNAAIAQRAAEEEAENEREWIAEGKRHGFKKVIVDTGVALELQGHVQNGESLSTLRGAAIVIDRDDGYFTVESVLSKSSAVITSDNSDIVLVLRKYRGDNLFEGTYLNALDFTAAKVTGTTKARVLYNEVIGSWRTVQAFVIEPAW